MQHELGCAGSDPNAAEPAAAPKSSETRPLAPPRPVAAQMCLSKGEGNYEAASMAPSGTRALSSDPGGAAFSFSFSSAAG